MASFAAGALATPAAHAAGVTVRLPDREARIDEATLRAAVDVPAGTLTLRGKDGAGDTIAHPPAISVARVLELAGVAPGAVSFVTVKRPNGTLCVLRAADLARPAPSPEGPPLVWLDAGSVRFLRPVRDGADVNAADNIATAGEDLAVRVHQGPLLEVAVRVAPARPHARERVRLEARVSGEAGGATLAVRWRFGDGTEATGPAVSHRWRSAGVYAVVASAEGDDDSGGASEPLVVRVGAPRKRPGGAGAGSDAPERSPATGPSEPPDDNSAAPPDASDPAPGTPTPEAPTPGASSPQASSPGASSPAAPSQRASPSRSSAPALATPHRQRLRARRGDAAPGGVEVSGVLVAATAPTPAPAAGAPGRSAAARRGGAREHRDATLAVGGALACALLAFGAWRERRRSHA